MTERRSSGFTLIELLVAVGLLAIVFVGVLNMLDTSTTISKVEAALADTQENVRFGAYHIMRTARMVGGGEMPFARADAWVAGQIFDEPVTDPEGGSVSVPGFGNLEDVAAGSDVLVVRGFFEVPPFFTNRLDINNPSDGKVTIRERRTLGDDTSDFINPLDNVPGTANALAGRGIVFMGRRLFAVGQISASALGGADPSRVLVLDYIPGDGTVWATLNPDGSAIPAEGPGFDVYRVGVLQSYTYYVQTDFRLMRRRAAAGGFVDEPVAVNIGALQVSIGLDTNADGDPDVFNPAPGFGDVTANAVSAMRITVLGRTPFEVKDWAEPTATFNVEGDDPDVSLFERGARWRRMDVTAGLRNYSL
jgi:prepilin-type N-terminal cleavage/methylation domain-containing protein